MADFLNYFTLYPDDDGEDGGTECKYCGEFPLWWTKIGNTRRLVNEDNEVHVCKEYFAGDDDPWRKRG